MDSTLAALFQQSAGPVQRPPKKDRSLPETHATEESIHQDINQKVHDDTVPISTETKERKKKQKKRKRDDVLLEDLYMSKLAEKPNKISKSDKTRSDKPVGAVKALGLDPDEEKEEANSAGESKDINAEASALRDDSDANSESDTSEQIETTASKPIHESHTIGKNVILHESQQRQDKELEKAKATVFVGNLPTTVITSHSTYKQLKALFAQYGTVKSIRFRSIAFSELLPRKVAFLQGKFHPERDTLNAYVVYAGPTEARKSLDLNGHHFLETKHIRVDSVAHPSAHQNKKCVFVGSLPFDAEEELLWTHFAQAGAIESVRVIRDKKTNVGKGFAYVQFKDSSSVQNALLLHDKKMVLGQGKGTRKLRVTKSTTMPSKHRSEQRERDQIHNPDLKPRDKAKLGRVKNLMGSQAAAKLKLLQKEIALEGERAKAPEGERTRSKKKKKSKNHSLRSKARAAAYRKADGDKTPPS